MALSVRMSYSVVAEKTCWQEQGAAGHFDSSQEIEANAGASSLPCLYVAQDSSTQNGGVYV